MTKHFFFPPQPFSDFVKHLSSHETRDNYGWVFVKFDAKSIDNPNSLTLVTNEDWIFKTLGQEEMEKLDKELESKGYYAVIEYQDIYLRFHYKYKNTSIEEAIKYLWQDVIDYAEYDCFQS